MKKPKNKLPDIYCSHFYKSSISTPGRCNLLSVYQGKKEHEFQGCDGYRFECSNYDLEVRGYLEEAQSKSPAKKMEDYSMNLFLQQFAGTGLVEEVKKSLLYQGADVKEWSYSNKMEYKVSERSECCEHANQCDCNGYHFDCVNYKNPHY